jgi:hypothetical protein
MPQPNKKKTTPSIGPVQSRFNDVIFVNWSLSSDEKAACKAWQLSMEDFDNALATIIEGGYKTTLSYDSFRSCYTASIVPSKDAKSNQGYILTGKGSTATKALKQALYIHFHVMGEEWAAYSTAKAVEDLDD